MEQKLQKLESQEKNKELACNNHQSCNLSVLQKVEKAFAAQDYDSREIIQMQSTGYKFLVNSLSCL